LSAALQIAPIAGGVRVSGRFEADVVQECVVTLAAVSARISGEVAVTVVPGAERGDERDDDEVDIDLDAEDVEIIQGDTFDLGEILIEHLALAIDPYPRAPGAVFMAPNVAGDPKSSRQSPFAVLAKLKSGSKSN
jgi:uncharacterized metal-binding protein YceD (DUF177 family)